MARIIKIQPASSKPKVVSIQRQNEAGRMQKSALAPALSPRRGRIVLRSFEYIYDWIGRTLIRKNQKQPKAISSPVRLRFDATIKFEPRRSAA
jgi:hypothetical protein